MHGHIFVPMCACVFHLSYVSLAVSQKKSFFFLSPFCFMFFVLPYGIQALNYNFIKGVGMTPISERVSFPIACVCISVCLLAHWLLEMTRLRSQTFFCLRVLTGSLWCK